MRWYKIGRDRESASGKTHAFYSIVAIGTLVAMLFVLAWARFGHLAALVSPDPGFLSSIADDEARSESRTLTTFINDLVAGRAPARGPTRGFRDIYLVDLDDYNAAIAIKGFGAPADFDLIRRAVNSVLAEIHEESAPMLRGGVSEDSDSSTRSSVASPESSRAVYVSSGGVSYLVAAQRLSAASRERIAPNEPSNHIYAVVSVRPVADSVLDSISADARLLPLSISATQSAERGVVAAPVASAGGSGAPMWLQWRPPAMTDTWMGYVTASLVTLAAVYAGFLALRSTRQLEVAEARALQLAGRDALSGIPNRLLFSSVLDNAVARARRDGQGFAIHFIDLDRFKIINDQQGHEVGDRIIIAVAQKLQARLRATDLVARLGGDEFAVLQSGVGSPADAEVLGDRLLAAIREPIDVDGTTLRVGGSIGISLCPRNGVERDILLQCADAALYDAKKGGRNRIAFFDAALSAEMESRRSLEEDLRFAIDHGKMELAYQPIVSIDGTRLMAVESLARWRHPTRGNISPMEFIPIAEKRGMILQLGEWVLRRACEDARQWPDIRVAVNVSAIQFRHPGFVALVQRVLQETGLDPARLELELTESVVVTDADDAETAMFDLRAMGVRLALDDFGTGYSSLIYLRRFAFDKIKIDKSFLESMEATGESAIIVHSVVHLGRSLGLTVVAEGVETSEQHRFLQALGAHELQGYMFSRPCPAADITEICANGRVMPKPKPMDFPGADSGEEAVEEASPIAGAA